MRMHRRRHYYAKTQSIKGFQPEIIDTLIEQGLPFSSPFRSSRCITFMEPRAASVRRKLLLLRQDHLMVELIAAWEPQDDEQRHLQWAQNLTGTAMP